MKKNRVYYIRSTSIINDSRASKEITSLINNGYDVTVIGWDRDKRIENYENIIINGNKVKSIFFKYQANYGKSFSTIKGLIKFQIFLLKTLKTCHKKINYIHACDFDCGFVANKIAKKYKINFIYDMYDYYVDSRPMPQIIKKLIEKMENNIINNANLTIICGEWREKQIAAAKPQKLIVIHNSPDLEYVDSKHIIKSKSKKLKVGYVGILQGDRLLLELLDKFKENDDYELHIGGFGLYEDAVKKVSEDFKNIFYYGSLKYDQVLALETDCDILFATYNPKIKNHKYSAPNKIYESMALGKTILVCKDTGIDKLISENEIGFAINYNAEEFINILKKIDNDKKLLEKIGKKSKELFNNKYSWKIMEKRLIEAYSKLNKEAK